MLFLLLSLLTCSQVYTESLLDFDERHILSKIKKDSQSLVVADEKVVDIANLHLNHDFRIFKSNVMTEDPWYSEHYKALTKNIDSLDLTSKTNSLMSLFGQNVFPVVLNSIGDVITAGGTYGKGRLIITTRIEYIEAYLNENLDKFMKNSITWLLNGKEETIATHNNVGITGFSNVEHNVNPCSINETVNVYKVNGHIKFSDEEIKCVQSFVHNGGGLILGAQAWYSGGFFALSYHNDIISKMGLIITNTDWNNKVYTTKNVPSLEYNLYYALQNLDLDISQNTILHSISNVVDQKTWNVSQFTNICQMAVNVYKSMNSEKYIRLFSILTSKLLEILLEDPNLDESKIPFAENHHEFPYTTPMDAEILLNQEIIINGNYEGYDRNFIYAGAAANKMEATGLYVKAGSLVTLEFPSDVLHKVYVMVGTHTDQLYHHETIYRSPSIVTYFNVKKNKFYVSNPWGGLLYITIPHGSTIGKFNVVISGAVKAPYFLQGTTTDEDWINTIRHYKAPWAELSTPGGVSLIVPSTAVRKLDNATELMTLWTEVMIKYNKLAGFENFTRKREERLLTDIQISAGYMHSGYPIMSHLDVADSLTNVNSLKKGSWGILHELGHNHQHDSWTVPATTETGCNFWAIYICQEQYGIPYAHPAIQPKDVRYRQFDFAFNGRPINQWNTFLALDTYNFLAERFSWNSYTELFKKYYSMDVVRSNKLDVWARYYSIEVNTNLCDYFEYFRFELSEETRAVCNSLPPFESSPLEYYTLPEENKDCLEGWKSLGESCFYISKIDAKGMKSAEETCFTNHNAHLASCMTDAEAFYLGYISKNIDASFFVGIYDSEESPNVFTNMNGSVAHMENYPWASSPDPNNNSHCVVLYRGQYVNYNCDSTVQYICKIGPTACGP